MYTGPTCGIKLANVTIITGEISSGTLAGITVAFVIGWPILFLTVSSINVLNLGIIDIVQGL